MPANSDVNIPPAKTVVEKPNRLVHFWETRNASGNGLKLNYIWHGRQFFYALIPGMLALVFAQYVKYRLDTVSNEEMQNSHLSNQLVSVPAPLTTNSNPDKDEMLIKLHELESQINDLKSKLGVVSDKSNSISPIQARHVQKPPNNVSISDNTLDISNIDNNKNNPIEILKDMYINVIKLKIIQWVDNIYIRVKLQYDTIINILSKDDTNTNNNNNNNTTTNTTATNNNNTTNNLSSNINSTHEESINMTNKIINMTTASVITITNNNNNINKVNKVSTMDSATAIENTINNNTNNTNATTTTNNNNNNTNNDSTNIINSNIDTNTNIYDNNTNNTNATIDILATLTSTYSSLYNYMFK